MEILTPQEEEYLLEEWRERDFEEKECRANLMMKYNEVTLW